MTLWRHVGVLHSVASSVTTIFDHARRFGLSNKHVLIIYRLVQDEIFAELSASSLALLEALAEIFSCNESVAATVDTAVGIAASSGLVGMLLKNLIEYALLWGTCVNAFRRLDELDYAGKKTKIERLHVREMAYGIDGQFVKLVTEHPADSRALA